MNMNISRGSEQHLEQNVRFSDQTADWSYTVPSNPDRTFEAAETQDATLAEFFSRPVRIHTFAWEVGTSVFEYIDPWVLFFHNLRVINRINNYNLLRAKLHVKIVLNGNGFYYGRILASYLPRPNNIFGSPLPRALVPQDLVKMSQLPHVYLDPTTSQGGDLDLPFFTPYNAISIPGDDFAQMGVLVFKDINPLAHANNGTTGVTVSVFCWATDVKLSIPTSTRNASISAQMGDEYATGPVSRPAAAIARAAGALAKIPAIAPYAKATQMAAGAVGGVASIFGYSRPTQVEQSKSVKPEYVGVLANANVPDNATKLTLDCKQEVTVDPRVVGLDSADEMTILSLAKRESYLASFTWSASQAPDTLLYTKYITPMSYAMYPITVYPQEQVEHHLTPVAFAALPFSYWRGTLKFRFQVVASAFHKGRFKVVQDPYLLQTASLSEYNVNYSYVADIASDRDFTLEFGWSQRQSWLPIQNLVQADASSPTGYQGILTTPAPWVGANGLFAIVVVNELASTTSVPTDVQINVFVSASDDFEVCVPSCFNLSMLSHSPGLGTGGGPGKAEFVAQMGDTADPVDTSTESAPVSEVTSDCLAPRLNIDNTLDVFFGDPVVSFRQCLKRYELSRTWQPFIHVNSSFQLLSYVLPDVPIYPGAVGGAIDQANTSTGPTPWNYTKNTLLNYLLPAYAARRGGLRWKYHFHGCSNVPASMSVTKAGEGLGYSKSLVPVFDQTQDYVNSNTMAQLVNEFYPHTWCATHVTDVRNNPTLEVEIPFYPNLRFFECRDTNVTSTNRPSTTGYHSLRAHYKVLLDDDPSISAYVSIAEDFNLFFFCGCPPVFTVTSPSGYVPE